MNKRSLILLISLLLFPAFSFAQDHSYTHYDVQEGLAGSTVYCMAQDKDGFIWFGTETGLSRFDGTHFKNFTTADGLPGNEVLSVYPDSKGRIWLIPFKNEVAYYWKGKIHTKQNDPVLDKLSLSGNPISFMEDGAGNILVKEYRGLEIIHPDGSIARMNSFQGKEFWFALKPGLNKDKAFRIGIVNEEVCFFLLDIQKDRITRARRLITHFGNNAVCSYVGPDLEIVKHIDSLIFMDPEGNRTFGMHIPKGLIGISCINDSTLAINTYMNTFLMDIREKKIKDSFLKDLTVNSVFEDSEGSLWFSTLGKGVYRLGSTEVGNYFFRGKNANLGVFCIREFDSTIYLGGDHFFLEAIDSKGTKVRSLQLSGDITRGRITSMARAGKKGIFVGTDVGLFELGKGEKRANQILTEDRSIKTISVEEGNLLLETSNYNIRRIALDKLLPLDTLWKERGTCAFRQNNVYYFGTLKGLYALGKDRRTIWLGDLDKAFANRIIAMDSSSDGTLWVATDGDGLLGYKDSKVVARITTEQGLTSNICRSIFVTADAIWVGTDKGLNKVTIRDRSYTIIPFTRADGLNADIINAIYVKGKKVYVGTPEGLNFFDESRISKRSGCNLRMTGINVSGKDWNYDTTAFILPHKDNNIQFDFAGISFKSAGSILYKYRLVGLNDAWKTTKATFLSYPSLPSGNYELQLMATNKFGVGSNTLSVKFTVDKLIWEKLWFRVSVLLLVAALVLLLFNYRVRTIREKDAERMDTVTKMAELEQMALRSQMNPHFIFNCMNSIQEYVIDKDVLGANEFITRFAHLIRQTLEFSARPWISLNEEIDYISTYLELEMKRFGNKFVYEILVDETADRQHHQIPPMILQPYLENAVRHGMGHRQDKLGKIRIRITLSPEHLVCILEDNGVGRREAARFKSKNAIGYQSMGMSLVAKRIDMLNKTGKSPMLISIEDLEDSGDAPGTRITLRFPIEAPNKT